MTWSAKCLFCDDIRTEADGRISLMVVYGTGVIGTGVYRETLQPSISCGTNTPSL